MMRQRVSLAMTSAMVSLLLGGCATLIHGPYQDVRIDSTPPGATATISPLLCERGPNFLDEKKKQTVTTPATVRLHRDNSYRVEVEKPGYRISTAQIVPSYDWVWAQAACGPCEAVGELPTFDMKGQILPVRFAEAAFYEYPKGFFRALGRGTRIFSPEALLGTSFKLKPKDAGYFADWHAVGTPEVSATLEPTGK
jgi:hypothetical protein